MRRQRWTDRATVCDDAGGAIFNRTVSRMTQVRRRQRDRPQSGRSWAELRDRGDCSRPRGHSTTEVHPGELDGKRLQVPRRRLGGRRASRRFAGAELARHRHSSTTTSIR